MTAQAIALAAPVATVPQAMSMAVTCQGQSRSTAWLVSPKVA